MHAMKTVTKLNATSNSKTGPGVRGGKEVEKVSMSLTPTTMAIMMERIM